MAGLHVAVHVMNIFWPSLSLTLYRFWPGAAEIWSAHPSMRFITVMVPGACYAANAVINALGGDWEWLPEQAIGAAVYAWLWWKTGGGDSTKKKLKKAKEAIAVLGARLTVVPAPG